MRAVVIVAVAAVVIAAAAVAAAAYGIAPFGFSCRLRSVDESEYVRVNEGILGSIPVYPGAQRVSTWNRGRPASDKCFPSENSPPYDGFATNHLYKLAPGTTSDDVIDFYDRRLLPAWRQAVVRHPASNPCDVSYRRGEAELGVRACSGSLLLRLQRRRS
jgi:hypothetical protein